MSKRKPQTSAEVQQTSQDESPSDVQELFHIDKRTRGSFDTTQPSVASETSNFPDHEFDGEVITPAISPSKYMPKPEPIITNFLQQQENKTPLAATNLKSSSSSSSLHYNINNTTSSHSTDSSSIIDTAPSSQKQSLQSNPSTNTTDISLDALDTPSQNSVSSTNQPQSSTIYVSHNNTTTHSNSMPISSNNNVTSSIVNEEDIKNNMHSSDEDEELASSENLDGSGFEDFDEDDYDFGDSDQFSIQDDDDNQEQDYDGSEDEDTYGDDNLDDQMLNDIEENNPSHKFKVYDVPCNVLTPENVREAQLKAINHVTGFLSINPVQAETLLWSLKWNSDALVERFIDNPAKVLQQAGVGTVAGSPSTPCCNSPYTPKPPQTGFECFICYDDSPDLTFSMECGHTTCLECYRQYAQQKIMDEGQAETLKCPQFKCTILLNRQAVLTLFEKSHPDVIKKYNEYLLKHFVMIMDKMAFCPSPDCQYILEVPSIKRIDPNKIVPTVVCNCKNSFCFACGGEDHRPATCSITSAWLKRCQDDSETANWIKANTQECPKCHSTIEKNGGCNHMTCKQCRYEFCWVCMGAWSSHGNQYYNCSRYDESEALEARQGQERSRTELNRYLHYYNRFRNHQQSLALDNETFLSMQQKMREIQESSGMSWIEVQFVSQAFEVLRQSRHTLTWTYAFAFYLKKTHESTIFEDNQANLEVSVEALSELFEKPAMDLATLKVQLVDKSQYVANRRIVMMEHAAKGLMNGTWQYQTSLLRGASVTSSGPIPPELQSVSTAQPRAAPSASRSRRSNN